LFKNMTIDLFLKGLSYDVTVYPPSNEFTNQFRLELFV
jgi:hypothetical protein